MRLPFLLSAPFPSPSVNVTSTTDEKEEDEEVFTIHSVPNPSYFVK